jgi:hypothetical protein
MEEWFRSSCKSSPRSIVWRGLDPTFLVIGQQKKWKIGSGSKVHIGKYTLLGYDNLPCHLFNF